ncbi:hypothetical protein CU669_16490 [Paramagnetospirillum kuznetsovii]|uniref:Thioredoxin domain-containing protein n=1 Tax=Paramagnetospirillum kuznetsovii TaxID=2053833 RepID=A0A364NUW0_9PROT|nr:SCO family protein [Paramagnetospirillum kuznetsovii]RAU20868.1 hypothetical protein CU669_16490 [Paramagnetospirillum kuznetsovii]
MRSLVLASLLVVLATAEAWAEYGRVPFSEVDTGLFRVEEAKFLGVKPDPATPLRDETGAPTTLGAYGGGKPVILVLSYYNCDGTCSVVNADLAAQLAQVEQWRLGADYSVLTVSFNAEEGPETLAKFRKTLDLPKGAPEGWRFALAGNSTDARRLADSVGFKYFWSAQDRAFLHPGLYVFLSPQGRVVRFLYSTNTEPRDVELALTDALGDQIRPAQILNFALSLCYSYSFKDGRYKLNLPMFFGFASLGVGVILFIISVAVYRRRIHRPNGRPKGEDLPCQACAD